MSFEGWEYGQRELTPGEIEFLDRIWVRAGEEPLSSNKTRRFLLVREIKVERVEVTIGGLRMMRAPGWTCIWNPKHTTGNTVHIILRQKFDTDLVMMRMYLS